ncbi:MAG: metal ABC transporter permease [Acetobacter sp.]|nr:metal ABC transporter permease [Acetobacter sp.]
MLAFEFMRQAFLASALVGLLAGMIGWFLVLRGQSFAGHALSHIGFAGATAALWAGMPPLAGLLIAATAGGMGMSLNNARHGDRDIAIGLTLSLAMGCGSLFLYLLHGPASTATALLFGNVFGINQQTLQILAGTVLAGLIGLGTIGRPLLFASLQPELAEARGVPVQLVSTCFMAMAGLATAICTEVTGVLLVFTLMIGPGATALRLGLNPVTGLCTSAILAIAEAWGGLTISWYTDAPVSFCIAALSAAIFGLTTLFRRRG